MANVTTITKRQRELITKHLCDPKAVTQAEVMRHLKLGRDYHAFYRLAYRVAVSNDNNVCTTIT